MIQEQTYAVDAATEIGSVRKAAVLAPLRLTKQGLETFMTRRAFWNYQKGRPMRYPGEYVFTGGQQDPGDLSLEDAALREFREETAYDGPIHLLGAVHEETTISNGQLYETTVYAAQVDEALVVPVREEGEVIGSGWKRPEQWLELITSEDFTKDQIGSFWAHGLMHPMHGRYQRFEREMPKMTMHTLEYLQEHRKQLPTMLLPQYH